MSKPRIAVIISSTRDSRFADKPAEWLMAQVKDHPELDFELVDLRDEKLPSFNEVASDLWVLSQDPKTVAWQQKMDGFDGYLVVLAEYNRSLPAPMKNALDLSYKAWNRKPIGALGYGSMGATSALQHLRVIAVELQMVPLRNAVHIGGGDFFKVWTGGENAPMSAIEGNLKGSLDALLDELVWWTKATRAARAQA